MEILNHDNELNKLSEDVKNKDIRAIVIGASIGGPQVLQSIITALPHDIGIPIFIVQHMASEMTEKFAKRLDSLSKLKIKHALHGDIIKNNIIYIAKGGSHMEISPLKKIVLSDGEKVCGVRPSVDILFESASKVYKESLVSIILTGMGRDGAVGTINVKKRNGYCISQSEKSCISSGMIKSSNQTGDIDLILPLESIAKAIIIIAKSG